jgi:hypothetical protein
VLEQFEVGTCIRQPYTLFLCGVPFRLQFSTSFLELTLQPANLDPQRLARPPKLLRELVQPRKAFLESLERRLPVSILSGVTFAVRSVRSSSSMRCQFLRRWRWRLILILILWLRP